MGSEEVEGMGVVTEEVGGMGEAVGSAVGSVVGFVKEFRYLLQAEVVGSEAMVEAELLVVTVHLQQFRRRAPASLDHMTIHRRSKEPTRAHYGVAASCPCVCRACVVLPLQVSCGYG